MQARRTDLHRPQHVFVPPQDMANFDVRLSTPNNARPRGGMMSTTPATDALIVYCTCPERDADTLATVLVDAQLVACVNIVPGVKSVFRWQGRVQRDTESLLIIKTTRHRYAELEEALRDRHSYELPELLAVPVQAGLPAYLDWINTSTT